MSDPRGIPTIKCLTLVTRSFETDLIATGLRGERESGTHSGVVVIIQGSCYVTIRGIRGTCHVASGASPCDTRPEHGATLVTGHRPGTILFCESNQKAHDGWTTPHSLVVHQSGWYVHCNRRGASGLLHGQFSVEKQYDLLPYNSRSAVAF